MEYKGSWRNTSGWGVICWVMAIMTLLMGTALFTPGLLVIGFAILFYLWLIGHRLRVLIDDDKLTYRGWLASHEVRWNEILWITNEFPYPKDRFRFGSTYEVKTANDVFLINLLYFPAEFGRKFHAKAKQLGHIENDDGDNLPDEGDSPNTHITKR